MGKQFKKKMVEISLAHNLLFAAVSGSGATCVVQPMDLIKNRMQTNKNLTVSTCLRSILAEKGITGPWTGLGAGLLRQCSYTTVRLGVYRKLEENFTPKSFGEKLGLGATAGFIGSLFGNPAEVCLIRMTADGNLLLAERRNYTSVFNALTRIIKEEGVTTLWRGATPTIARAIVVNAAQLATYSQAKQIILGTGYIQDGIFCHFVASMISGLATTIASMPG